MKQDAILSPSLCGYLNFYHILGEMEQDHLISLSDKKYIKQKLTIKDSQLLKILAKVQEDEELKNDLLDFLKTTRPSGLIKRNSKDLSPCKRNTGSLIQQTTEQIGELIKSLKCVLHQEEEYIPSEFRDKLNLLRNIINEVDELQENDSTIPTQLQQCYQTLKQRYSRYLKSLLILMDEKVEPKNIQEFLNNFLDQLVGCKSYSYIIIKDLKMIIHQEDKIDQFDCTKDILDELIPLEYITNIQNLVQMRRFFKPGNYLLKLTDDQYFVLQLNEDFMDFILLAQEYNYTDSIIDLCQFVLHTSQQIKVQYFSLLSIGDTVLEIGLDIVRCSKYLLIHQIIKLLNQQYKIEKIIDSTQNQFPIIKFRDTHFIQYKINLNLSTFFDIQIYNQTQGIYSRYQQFIKQCYERMTFYKYFIRSKNLLMIDFDKQGKLSFMSRALSQKVKQQLQIEKISLDEHYKIIFQSNQSMIQNIECYISNSKWKVESHEEENPKPCEIFIRKEEKRFKGFTLIISENDWIRRKTQPPINGKSVRQQLLQTETMDYIKKLEEFNPDIRNSVVAMYMPQQQELPIFPQQTQKTPTLVFRKIDKEQVVGKKSFFYQVRQQEQQAMKINPNKFNESHLKLKEDDDILDSLDFNIHLITNMIEKQRIVWAMLERNQFIQMFGLPQDKLVCFLNEIEQNYNMNNNPYHNYDHGIAVMQSTNYFIKEILDKLGMSFFNNITKFCLLISGLCHDVAHSGRTNTFEANSLSMLAVRYHDKVILEQHHAATTIKILRETATNILCNFSDQDFRQFRKSLVSNILATDMQEHFKMLKEFESRIQQYGNDPEDLTLLCGMLTHTADFNGTARKWPQSKLWSEKINKEYSAQYEEEGKKGYPQQAFMKDLDNLTVMSKNEMGFIKVIVRPLYNTMNTFSKGAFQIPVNNLDETIFEWDKIYQCSLQDIQSQQKQENEIQAKK